jgi:hypothetical protein
LFNADAIVRPLELRLFKGLNNRCPSSLDPSRKRKHFVSHDTAWPVQYKVRQVTDMWNATPRLQGWAIAAGLVCSASLAVVSLSACGPSAASDGMPRSAYDHGSPASTVLATPTDVFSAKFGVAWWEASAQNYSSVNTGDARVAILVYGHDSSGSTTLSGQIVLDTTRVQSMTGDATISGLASAFAGTSIANTSGAALSAQDRFGLLKSVVDSMATVPVSELGSSSLQPGTLSPLGTSDDTMCSKDAVEQLSSSIASAMQGYSNCNSCSGYASILAQDPVRGAASPNCQACAQEVITALQLKPVDTSNCPLGDAGAGMSDAAYYDTAFLNKDGHEIGNLCDGCGGEINTPDEGGTSLSGEGGGSGSGDDGGGTSCDNSSKNAPTP